MKDTFTNQTMETVRQHIKNHKILKTVFRGLGFGLSILDVQNGQQPFESDDGRFLQYLMVKFTTLNNERNKDYNFKSTSMAKLLFII